MINATVNRSVWALLDDVADDWYGFWEIDWSFNAAHPDWPFESRLRLFYDLVQRGLIEILCGQLGTEGPALEVNVAVDAISLREAWLPVADINEAIDHISTSGVGRSMLAKGAG